jgi:hypothetical protein
MPEHPASRKVKRKNCIARFCWRIRIAVTGRDIDRVTLDIDSRADISIPMSPVGLRRQIPEKCSYVADAPNAAANHAAASVLRAAEWL